MVTRKKRAVIKAKKERKPDMTGRLGSLKVWRDKNGKTLKFKITGTFEGWKDWEPEEE